jgi:hypothetical protein
MDAVLKQIVVECYRFREYNFASDGYEVNVAVLNYLQAKYMNTFLKVQAITQLGYSRGGTDTCLPDDIVNQIKSFVFYDLTDNKMQQKISWTIFKEHEHLFEYHWKHSRCNKYCCKQDHDNCARLIKNLIYENIVEYVKNK